MKPWPVLEESYWNSSIFASIKIIKIHTSRLPFERRNFSSDHSLCILSITLKIYTAHISLKKCILIINFREVHPNLIWPPVLNFFPFSTTCLQHNEGIPKLTILQQKLKYSSWACYTWNKSFKFKKLLGWRGIFLNSFQSVVSAYLTQALFLEAVWRTHISLFHTSSVVFLLFIAFHYK